MRRIERRFWSLFMGLWAAALVGCQSGDATAPSGLGPGSTVRFAVGASAAQITDGQTVRILAVYNDSTGTSQLQGGSLQSPDGAVRYGDFVPLGDGSFIFELSWAALHQAAAISFDVEDRRTVRAVMIDSTGGTLQRDVTLRLYCSAAGASACNGQCLPIGGTCAGAGGSVCLAGQCKPGCFVGSVYYSAQAINGAQACQVCDPSASVSAWSSRPDGTSCAVNSTCQGGRCVSGSLKIPTGITDDFSAIWGSGPGDIYATTTSGLVLRTTDGWATFKNVTPAGAMDAFRGVSGSGAAQVISIGNFGAVYRTTVNGTSWTQPSSSTTNTLYAIWGAAGTLVAVGAGGTIIKSSDGGQSWASQSSATVEALHGVWGSDANVMVAAGDNGAIVRTSNGGTTWSPVSSGVATTFFAVTATDANTYYAAGSNAVVLRSDDAGQTWKTLTSLGVVGNARSLWGTTADGIYVGISNGTIWRSLDRGQTWSSVATGGATNSWYGIWGTPGGAAYAVGATGSVVRVQ